ncbi:MAG TPA: TIGR03009 domain-containing protein [Gemmataceae bacterium]|nr:TIGR03009 domain-containing protein [Gemmataceae bacterium]
MRVLAFSLVALLGVAAPIFAQAGAPQMTKQEADYLNAVLMGWEKSMTELRSFITEVERETLDKSVQSKDQFKGYALFLKANVKDSQSRARLELANVKKPQVFEKYIVTGTYLYEYVPANKVVRVHDMPQPNGKGQQQESFLSFLFGMGAKQAVDRYDMKPVFSKTPDPNYHYISVRPKLAQDKNDFAEARLSLYKSNYLPAQIWYLQPNGNQITWNFTKLKLDKDIPLEWFRPDMPSKEWRVERVQPKAAPTVQPTVRKTP